MASLLTVHGIVTIASSNVEFKEVYPKTYLKNNNTHMFPVRLGITNNQWAVRPYPNAPKPKQIEYDILFNFSKDSKWDMERTVLLGQASTLLYNGVKLEPPPLPSHLN